MTVLEVMEKVGSRETYKIIQLIKDGLQEISELFPVATSGKLISVVAKQRLYTIPTNAVKILGVYRQYDDSTATTCKYVRIPSIQNLDMIQSTGATT